MSMCRVARARGERGRGAVAISCCRAIDQETIVKQLLDVVFTVWPGPAVHCTHDPNDTGVASLFGFAKVSGYSNNSEGRMSDNRYSDNGRVDLKPGDLFFWIALDEIQTRVGFDDLAAAAAILLGQADVPAPGKFASATKGTSVASITARKLLPIQMRIRLPMIMSVGAQGVRIASTKNLGAWVGRTIPVVGEVLLAADAVAIMFNTVRRYNVIVKPENRVF